MYKKIKYILQTSIFTVAILLSPLSMSAEWGYTGSIGPAHWGSMPGFELCGNGTEQSPIDITSGATSSVNLRNLATDYSSIALDVENNGHTIQINVAPGSTIETPTGRYYLLQYHFHYVSEHTVEGLHSELEAHFVHMNSQGQLGVLGVFIEPNSTGLENPTLATILSNAPLSVGKTTLMTNLNVGGDLLPNSTIGGYWHYDGSLTTPPCSEGVKWYIAQEHIYASTIQIEEMAALLHHNNYRPTQSVNGRSIKKTGKGYYGH